LTVAVTLPYPSAESRSWVFSKKARILTLPLATPTVGTADQVPP